MRIVAILTLVGLSVGIFGGVIDGDVWFHGGEAVFFVGLVILFLYAWWKRPKSILDVDAEGPVDEPPCINIPRAEQELQRKNRGTVPTEK